MTIRKGQQWGTMQVPVQPLTTVSCDDELRQLVISARDSSRVLSPIGLLGGDLMRTLGGTADIARFSTGEPIPHLPIDIVRVVADESRETFFVAHLVAPLPRCNDDARPRIPLRAKVPSAAPAKPGGLTRHAG